MIARRRRKARHAGGRPGALAQLCQTYWAPLYHFVRSRGYAVHDAQDLTQSFFAYLIEKKIYARADRQKGKFRSFLLASLKNFLADAYDREQTLKRGGGRDFLPLNERAGRKSGVAFSNTQPCDQMEIEDRFRTHLGGNAGDRRPGTARDQLQNRRQGEALRRITNFSNRERGPLPSYADLAVSGLGTQESTLRSHVTRLRARYREALRAEVRYTVNSEAEVDGELRELLRVLTAS